MDQLLEQFKKAKDQVHLSEEKKAAMRANILHFVEAHEAEKRSLRPASLWWSSLKVFGQLRLMPTLSLLLLLALIGGTTSLAAETSLPGDRLYTLKVYVNEPLVAALSVSDKSKAEWETRRAERRLHEATKLASEGRLDSGTEDQLTADFKLHETRIRSRIEKLETAGEDKTAASLAAQFEGLLQAHQYVFQGIQSEGQKQVAALETQMYATLDNLRSVRTKLEQKIQLDNSYPTATAAEQKIKAVSKTVLKSGASIVKKVGQFGFEAAVTVEPQMKKVDELLSQARAKYEAAHYGEAFTLANEATRIVQESKTMIEAQTDFNLDFEASTSSETLFILNFPTITTGRNATNGGTGSAVTITADMGTGVGSSSTNLEATTSLEIKGKGKGLGL